MWYLCLCRNNGSDTLVMKKECLTHKNQTELPTADCVLSVRLIDENDHFMGEGSSIKTTCTDILVYVG